MTTVILLARRVQPAAFALALACLSIGITWLGFDRIDGPWEQIVAVSGMFLFAWLTVGWLWNSNRMLRWGLLAGTFLWVYVALVAMLTLRSPANWMLAVCWAVLAAGSYWLEERDYAFVQQRLDGP